MVHRDVLCREAVLNEDGPDVRRARLYPIEEGFTGDASISAAKPGARALYS
jgi:hypothetical protein